MKVSCVDVTEHFLRMVAAIHYYQTTAVPRLQVQTELLLKSSFLMHKVIFVDI